MLRINTIIETKQRTIIIIIKRKIEIIEIKQ